MIELVVSDRDRYNKARRANPAERDGNSWASILKLSAKEAIEDEEYRMKKLPNWDYEKDLAKNKLHAVFFIEFVNITNHEGHILPNLAMCTRYYTRVVKPITEDYMRKKLKQFIADGWLEVVQKGKLNYYKLALNKRTTAKVYKLAIKTLGIGQETEKK